MKISHIYDTLLNMCRSCDYRNVVVTIVVCAATTWLLSSAFFIDGVSIEQNLAEQWLRVAMRGAVASIVVGLGLWLHSQSTRTAIMVSVSVIAIAECILAFLQTINICSSNHDLFKITGTFYNPGPLAGFLAMALPVALGAYIETYNKWLRFVFGAAAFLIVCILPATASRTAYIAAAISCAVVFFFLKRDVFRKWTVGINRKMVYGASAIIILGSSFALWHINADSASGRLLIWKIAAKGIIEEPIKGYGSFMPAYADLQEQYFAQGGTEAERWVAGVPDCAFNEYINIAFEHGIPMALGLIAISIATIWLGIRNRRIGEVGAIVSIEIFAFASYPFKIPVIVATSIIIMLLCIHSNRRVTKFIVTLALLTISAFLMLSVPNLEKEVSKQTEYAKARIYYVSKSYYAVAALYPKIALNNDAQFLYEWGHALHKEQKYAESDSVLCEAQKISGDPMILNIRGKNLQSLGKYAEAEQMFLKSANRLPNRVYPYFLLYKLYSEPAFYNDAKRQAAADSVLHKKPKTESEAIEEMREIVRKSK